MPSPLFFKQPFTGHFPGLTAVGARAVPLFIFLFPLLRRSALYLASALVSFSFPQRFAGLEGSLFPCMWLLFI